MLLLRYYHLGGDGDGDNDESWYESVSRYYTKHLKDLRREEFEKRSREATSQQLVYVRPASIIHQALVEDLPANTKRHRHEGSIGTVSSGVTYSTPLIHPRTIHSHPQSIELSPPASFLSVTTSSKSRKW